MAWRVRYLMFYRRFAFFIFMSLSTPAIAEPYVVVHPLSLQTIDKTFDTRMAKRVPGNASLVEKKQMRDRRGVTIKDLTDFIPSVYAQPRNGAEAGKLSVRGSGLANTFQGRGLLVMVDGVPINNTSGEFELAVLNPWLADYVRVLPGANALAEGASTLGGAIDFITPQNAEGGSVRAETGSFGTTHGFASYGRSGVFAAASGFHQDGFRDHNKQDIAHWNVSAGWRSDLDLAQRLFVSHTISNAQIPGAISNRELHADPSQANPNNFAGRFRRDLDITRVAHRAAWQDGLNRLESTLYYMYRTLDNPVTTYIKEDNNDMGLRLKYLRGAWSLGINLAYGVQNETRYTNVAGNAGAPILNRDLSATNSEIYAQYEHPLGQNLSGIISLQGALNTRDITQETPTVDRQTKTYLGFNPRLGLRYDFDDVTQGFLNLSRSYEPPSWAELSGGNAPGFNNLNEQTATTLELGGRGQNWSAAVFRSYLRDEFVNYKFADGSTDTINVPASIHDGLELGWDGAIADNFELRATYTLSRFGLDDDPLYGGNRLPGMPKHYLRGELMYDFASGLSFGPNIEWASGYPVDLTNSFHAKSYAILGARAFWQSEDQRIETYVEGRNLLDRKYAATTNVIPDAGGADGRFYYPGEGRSLYAGLRVKF